MASGKLGVQLFIVCLFVFFLRILKAAPIKVKANRRKSRTLVYRVSVKINLQKENYYPSQTSVDKHFFSRTVGFSLWFKDSGHVITFL